LFFFIVLDFAVTFVSLLAFLALAGDSSSGVLLGCFKGDFYTFPCLGDLAFEDFFAGDSDFGFLSFD
jgi:hypothetical protein